MTGLMGIVVACTAMGYSFSFGLLHRVNSIKEIRRMMELLRGEIRYAVTPLGEAFLNISRYGKEPFQTFFRKAAEDMERRDGKTLTVIFKECSAVLQKESGLRETDIQMLIQMGGKLGYLDVEMQMRTIDYYIEELEKACAMAEEEYQGKGKVYRSLGFMGGLFLAVVLL